MKHAAQSGSLLSLLRSVLGIALLLGVGCSGGGGETHKKPRALSEGGEELKIGMPNF